jgi:hypothetical protein
VKDIAGKMLANMEEQLRKYEFDEWESLYILNDDGLLNSKDFVKNKRKI